jgi:hypothetical protein
MDKRVFLILIAAALALIAIWYPTTKAPEVASDELLMPGLREQLNDIDNLTITAGGGRLVATLMRGPTRWTVSERSDYPADVGKIRKNLIALADARILEEKTSDPTLYDRLAVEDIDQEKANGIQVIIRQSGQGPDEAIAMIIGNTGVGGKTAYVRRPGEARSFLVKADFDLSKDTSDWMMRDLMDISSADIHSVTIDHPDGATLRIQKPARTDSDFTVLDLPDGREIEYASVGNSIGGTLSALKFDDVILASDLDTATTSPVLARFETFDGLVIETSAYKIEEQTRVAIRARADEFLANRFRTDDNSGVAEDEQAGQADESPFNMTAKQADELNSTLGPWMYTLPSFKADQLVKRLDDLLKPANE